MDHDVLMYFFSNLPVKAMGMYQHIFSQTHWVKAMGGCMAGLPGWPGVVVQHVMSSASYSNLLKSEVWKCGGFLELASACVLCQPSITSRVF